MAQKSLGKITVAAAGTPVRATTNESTPTARYAVQSYTVFAPAANSGANIYVGASGMNKTTYAGVYAIIPKGGSGFTVIQNAPAGINMAEIFIDADTNSDVCLISVTEQ